MKLNNLRFRRIARRSGGLFLGAKLHFPGTFCEEVGPLRWTAIWVSFGLLLWQLEFSLDYNHRTEA